MGNKTFNFSSKKKDFLLKNDQIWLRIGIFGRFGPGHAGFFGALLVGQLVVLARGLYLARHLFTLCFLAVQESSKGDSSFDDNININNLHEHCLAFLRTWGYH